MKKLIVYKILFLFLLSIFNVGFVYASKYTIVNGKEFNNRIKLSINSNYNSATPEYTITGFKNSPQIKGDAIDISEDGDSSVIAYIDNGIIYFVSDEDVFLNEDASFMFDRFVNLREVDLTYLNFDKTKKTNFMFSNCKYLTKLDMDNDTQIKLNEMEGMFFDCQSLVDLNIYMLNTSNVKNMNSLFYNCKNLKNININPSIWSINKVTNFNKMYYNCLMLKTNFNLKATSIDESKYKIYSVAGDEFREGLLRNYDYDYDELVLSNETVKVDTLKSNIVKSSENSNEASNIKNSDIEYSKKFLNINVASNSELYEQRSDDKNNTDKNINYNTMKDVPILIDETTFVDKLVPKKKASVSNAEIIPPSDYVSSTPSSVLRPNYDDVNIAESTSIEIDTKIIEPETFKSDFIKDNLQTILIIVLILALIIIGGAISFKKDKDDNFGL